MSSGHSIIFGQAEGSGHDQLIGVPGYAELFRPETLVNLLRNSPALWFFSWGRAETGVHKIEAEEQGTANFLRELPNVTIAIHDGGHVFPVEAIQEFLANTRLRNSYPSAVP